MAQPKCRHNGHRISRIAGIPSLFLGDNRQAFISFGILSLLCNLPAFFLEHFNVLPLITEHYNLGNCTFISYAATPLLKLPEWYKPLKQLTLRQKLISSYIFTLYYKTTLLSVSLPSLSTIGFPSYIRIFFMFSIYFATLHSLLHKQVHIVNFFGFTLFINRCA